MMLAFMCYFTSKSGYIKYFNDGGKICHLLWMMKKFIKSIMKYGK